MGYIQHNCIDVILEYISTHVLIAHGLNSLNVSFEFRKKKGCYVLLIFMELSTCSYCHK